MTVPHVFRNPAAENNVNFDYDDIVDGFKITRMYAATYKDSSGESKIMTNDSNWISKSLETTAAIPINTNSFTKLFDVDFDGFPVSKTLTIEGQGSIQFNFFVDLSHTDSNGGYVIFKLRKWDGATETEIVSVQSETVDDDDTVAPFTLPITIPRTQIAEGEQIRLTAEGWGKNDSISIALGIELRHDPQTTSNELILNLPKVTI